MSNSLKPKNYYSTNRIVKLSIMNTSLNCYKAQRTPSPTTIEINASKRQTKLIRNTIYSAQIATQTICRLSKGAKPISTVIPLTEQIMTSNPPFPKNYILLCRLKHEKRYHFLPIIPPNSQLTPPQERSNNARSSWQNSPTNLDQLLKQKGKHKMLQSI